MKYRNISLKNFRGISSCQINDCGLVNVFVGRNNTGKSSVLEAIFLLTGPHTPQAILSLELLRNLVLTELNDLRFLFYKLDFDNPMELSAEMYEENETRTLNIAPKNDASDRKIISQSNKHISNVVTKTSEETAKFSYGDLKFNSLELTGRIKRRHTQTTEIKSSLTMELMSAGPAQYKIHSNNPSYTTNFKALFQSANPRTANDLVQRLERIIVDKNKTQLISNLKLIDNSVSDIVTGVNNMIFLDIGAKRMIPANLMGDGFLKFLSIITNFNEVPDGVLLIDEIDNGLHFSTLKTLWKYVFKTAADSNTQVFVTTHSHDTLKYLNEALQDEDMRTFSNDLRCFTFSKTDDNVVKTYKYETRDLDLALENDIEIRGKF